MTPSANYAPDVLRLQPMIIGAEEIARFGVRRRIALMLISSAALWTLIILGAVQLFTKGL